MVILFSSQREKLPELNDGEEDRLDDQPVVVVLKPGDLTAEQADKEKKRLDTGEQLLINYVIMITAIESTSNKLYLI